MIRALFAGLKDTLLSLPPEDGYRLNTAAAVENVCNAGEFKTARWQSVQLLRWLRAERVEWAGGVGVQSAVPLPT